MKQSSGDVRPARLDSLRCICIQYTVTGGLHAIVKVPDIDGARDDLWNSSHTTVSIVAHSARIVFFLGMNYFFR
jgi:hypothetical protein